MFCLGTPHLGALLGGERPGGGLNDVHLPGHPAVYDHIRGWLERDGTRRQDELAAAPGP